MKPILAQIDPEVAKIIPSKWVPYVLFSLAMLPYLTRAWHGWKDAGGWRGVWGAVMNGTNVPKQISSQVAANTAAIQTQTSGTPPAAQPPATL